MEKFILTLIAVIFAVFIMWILAKEDEKEDEEEKVRNQVNSIMNSGIFSGGDGASEDSAIIIQVNNSQVGILAEAAYVKNYYYEMHDSLGVSFAGELKFESQMQITQNGKHFDVVTVCSKFGGEKTFWFDITAFYGRA